MTELTSAISKVRDIPRPENWGGYIIVTPSYFEFWQGRASRSARSESDTISPS